MQKAGYTNHIGCITDLESSEVAVKPCLGHSHILPVIWILRGDTQTITTLFQAAQQACHSLGLSHVLMSVWRDTGALWEAIFSLHSWQDTFKCHLSKFSFFPRYLALGGMTSWRQCEVTVCLKVKTPLCLQALVMLDQSMFLFSSLLGHMSMAWKNTKPISVLASHTKAVA